MLFSNSSSRSPRTHILSRAIEPLEARRLLSASAGIEDGVIVARGTETQDYIQLERVTGSSSHKVRITIWNASSSTPVLVAEFNRWHEGRWHPVRLEGLGGNDFIWSKRGQSEGATMLGGAGHDTLVGAEGQDYLFGGSGNDKLFAAGGARNELHGDSGHDILWGGGGRDTMHGGSENDTLRGHWGDDELHGGSGNDRLDGGDGNDWIYARDGSTDTLDGGAGFDRAERDPFDSTRAIEQFLNEQPQPPVHIRDRVLIGNGTSGNDIFHLDSGPEGHLISVTLNGTDYLFDRGEFDRVHLRGLAGHDSFGANDLYDLRIVYDGGDGNDTLYKGGRNYDTFLGGAGDDAVDGSVNDNFDRLVYDGGIGRDRIFGDIGTIDLRNYTNVEDASQESGTIIGNDLNNCLVLIAGGTLYGMGGDDVLLVTEDGTVTMDGGDGNDLLDASAVHGSGKATLLGGNGNDTLRGGENDDLLQGGPGHDTADYSFRTQDLVITLDDSANDGANGGSEGDNVRSDIERVLGGSGNDILTGNNGNNVLRGNGGNDTLFGLGGSDALFGGAGNDWLDGGLGDDYLEGGSGDDTLIGGGGNDTYAD